MFDACAQTRTKGRGGGVLPLGPGDGLRPGKGRAETVEAHGDASVAEKGHRATEAVEGGGCDGGRPAVAGLQDLRQRRPVDGQRRVKRHVGPSTGRLFFDTFYF